MLSSMNSDIPSWAWLLDTRPLAGPVDRAAAKAYREQLSAQGISRGRPPSLKNCLLGGFLAFFLINLAMVIDALWGGWLICIFLAAAVVLAMVQQYRSENPAPHMVLDAKGTRAVTGTGMPRSISAQHQVPLGPEAEERFSLYALTEHHEDARALFNPELLRRLQESPGLFDIEVVDDWIFVYAPGEIVTSDPNTWSWAASVTDALLGAAQRWQGSTQESRDERGSTARCGPGTRAEALQQQTLRAADRSDAGTAGTVHRGGHTPGIVRGTSRRPAPDAL